MLIFATRVWTYTKLSTHLCIDTVLELLVKLDYWLKKVSGVWVDLIKLTSKSKITVSFNVFGSGISRCDQDASKNDKHHRESQSNEHVSAHTQAVHCDFGTTCKNNTKHSNTDHDAAKEYDGLIVADRSWHLISRRQLSLLESRAY